jgi:hypothetical protein
LDHKLASRSGLRQTSFARAAEVLERQPCQPGKKKLQRLATQSDRVPPAAGPDLVQLQGQIPPLTLEAQRAVPSPGTAAPAASQVCQDAASNRVIDQQRSQGRMGGTLDTAIGIFEQNRCLFTHREGQPLLQMGFRGKNGWWIRDSLASEKDMVPGGGHAG